jgi:hypothetical protein
MEQAKALPVPQVKRVICLRARKNRQLTVTRYQPDGFSFGRGSE